MRRIGIAMLCLTSCLLAARPAAAQKEKAKPKAAKEVSADELGKVMVALGGSTMNEKYEGKKLRIRGKIESVALNYVYLHTDSKFKDGSAVKVVLIFPEKSLPKDLEVGKEIAADGTFDYAGAMGPGFRDCVPVSK